ncbi:MAG: hypothetical protein QOE96_2426 [Blastocatellia bacterium]|jgi:hypothetical protein|nr:hypothetical protein [Blastocatellia bacterium]
MSLALFESKTIKRRERETWGERVVRETLWAIPKGSTITLLAGNDCGEPIETKLKQNGFSVNRPL